VTRLLVQPGDQVSGSGSCHHDQPELAELRTTALDRRAEAIGSTQQAKPICDWHSKISLNNRKLQRRTLLKPDTNELCSGQFDKDRELAGNGAPRRTFLESETKLAEAKAALARAESRLDV